jgi:hypothetical protein
MSKTKLRIAALATFIAGMAAYPVSVKYLLPLAASTRGADGQLYVLSPTVGTWVLPAGFIAAVVLLGLSLTLLLRSFSQPREA